jgi:nucleoside-diphosphate-sugar epimerase
MKILFIGGTGNISTECASLLYKRGHEISVVTRGRSSVPAEYTPIRADRGDLAALRAALKGLQPEVVINFLGYEVAHVQTDFDLFRDTVRQYVFISSTTVYAKPHRQLPLTETAPLGNAYWEYARKKQQCEEWLQAQAGKSRFPVTIVRPSHTYSQTWIPNPVSSATYTLAARLENGQPVFVPDDGENPWTLTASSDFAVGLAGLVGNEQAIGEVFHLTSDEVLTWNQIYAEIATALGVTTPKIVKIPTEFICETSAVMIGKLKGDKSNPGIFDNAKIKRFVPSFRCLKPFRQGIREAVAWFRERPERKRIDPEANSIFDQVIAAWRAKGAPSPA